MIVGSDWATGKQTLKLKLEGRDPNTGSQAHSGPQVWTRNDTESWESNWTGLWQPHLLERLGYGSILFPHHLQRVIWTFEFQMGTKKVRESLEPVWKQKVGPWSTAPGWESLALHARQGESPSRSQSRAGCGEWSRSQPSAPGPWRQWCVLPPGRRGGHWSLVNLLEIASDD